jgi:hypothetical protein
MRRHNCIDSAPAPPFHQQPPIGAPQKAKLAMSMEINGFRLSEKLISRSTVSERAICVTVTRSCGGTFERNFQWRTIHN